MKKAWLCWPDGLVGKEEEIFPMFSQPLTIFSKCRGIPVLTPLHIQRKAGAVRRAKRRDRRVSQDLQGQLLHHPCSTPAPTNAGTLQAFHCLCSPLFISWVFCSHSFNNGVKEKKQPRLLSLVEILWKFKRTQLFPYISALICTNSAPDARHCKWCMKWNLLTRLMQRRKAP